MKIAHTSRQHGEVDVSAAENKQLMQEIFARVAEGDGSLFVDVSRTMWSSA
jgi:hypothetical protein